ncbi:MAG: SPASM domain-containing protein [Lentisphaeria bacterium]|nr:SPASM domain-containing protein [Lentisphaeria bacterium]
MRIYLEITNNCNKSCDFCTVTKRKKGFIKLETFRERLKKISGFADEVYLHILGEPLLHREIREIFTILAEYEINFKITSNGTLLDESKKVALVENPFFKQINFSLHALNDAEIHGEVMQGILHFSELLMQKRDDVFVNYRLWNYSSNDEAKNSVILAEIADFFQLKSIQIPNNRRSKKLLDRIYLNVDKKFDWPADLPNQNTESEKIVHGFCHGGSSQLGILLDGSVVPCCLDSEGAITLGNIDEVTDFQKILNAPRLQNMVKNFADNIVSEPFCQKCTFRKRFL